MAQRTVARMYDSYDVAAKVVSDLETAGVPHGDISIVSNDQRYREGVPTGVSPLSNPVVDDPTVGRTDVAGAPATSSGAGAGASVGTILGGGAGLLAGIGALAIPGVGPVVAAGWLIATLTGAGVGAAAGGLIGSLTGAGLTETEAHVYGEGVRRGGTLVTARVDETMADRVTSIMAQHNPVDIEQRGSEYRQAGWSRFDETSGPYSSTTAPIPPIPPVA